MHAALIEKTAATALFFERGKRASRRPRGVLSESLKERELGQLAVGQDIYSQSNFHYTNLAGSVNLLPISRVNQPGRSPSNMMARITRHLDHAADDCRWQALRWELIVAGRQ